MYIKTNNPQFMRKLWINLIKKIVIYITKQEVIIFYKKINFECDWRRFRISLIILWKMFASNEVRTK